MAKHGWHFIWIGLMGLLVGAVFYWTCRTGDTARISLAADDSNPLSIGMIFYYRSFPTFIHVFALSALTFAFLRASLKNAIISTAIWFGTNFVYEILSSTIFTKQSVLLFYGDKGDVLFGLLGSSLFILVVYAQRVSKKVLTPVKIIYFALPNLLLLKAENREFDSICKRWIK